MRRVEESLRLVRGQGRYSDDIATIERAAYLCVVRSASYRRPDSPSIERQPRPGRWTASSHVLTAGGHAAGESSGPSRPGSSACAPTVRPIWRRITIRWPSTWFRHVEGEASASRSSRRRYIRRAMLRLKHVEIDYETRRSGHRRGTGGGARRCSCLVEHPDNVPASNFRPKTARADELFAGAPHVITDRSRHHRGSARTRCGAPLRARVPPIRSQGLLHYPFMQGPTRSAAHDPREQRVDAGYLPHQLRVVAPAVGGTVISMKGNLHPELDTLICGRQAHGSGRAPHCRSIRGVPGSSTHQALRQRVETSCSRCGEVHLALRVEHHRQSRRLHSVERSFTRPPTTIWRSSGAFLYDRGLRRDACAAMFSTFPCRPCPVQRRGGFGGLLLHRDDRQQGGARLAVYRRAPNFSAGAFLIAPSALRPHETPLRAALTGWRVRNSDG